MPDVTLGKLKHRECQTYPDRELKMLANIKHSTVCKWKKKKKKIGCGQNILKQVEGHNANKK